MRGFLVRVGIDSTSGKWNAPVDEKKRFIFVPIPDCPYNPTGEYIEGGKRTYDEVLCVLNQFKTEYNGHSVGSKYFELPAKLRKAAMHLDPDFLYMTYGDSGSRGKPLKDLNKGDFVVFYSSLRSIQTGKLVYALIGMLMLERKPICETQIEEQKLRNAHSRWFSLAAEDDDVILCGDADSSGLFDKSRKKDICNDRVRSSSSRIRESLCSGSH